VAVTAEVIEIYLNELRSEAAQRGLNPDTLVLGCTHYPLLRTLFEQAVRPGAKVIDSAESAAQAAVQLFNGRVSYPASALQELPPLDIRFYEGPRETSPRGLGALGANVVAPALLSAIRQAVGPDLKSIPVSRKMLDEALRYHETSFYPER